MISLIRLGRLISLISPFSLPILPSLYSLPNLTGLTYLASWSSLAMTTLTSLRMCLKQLMGGKMSKNLKVTAIEKIQILWRKSLTFVLQEKLPGNLLLGL